MTDTQKSAGPFRTTRRVEFFETDMAGIVHFSNFYRFMEQAEHDYFRSLGLTIMKSMPDGSIIGWPRVSSQCRFEAPAYYDDTLDVHVYVARRGVKSLTFNVEFYRDETRIARGQLKTVCCRVRQHGQPLESIEIPADYDSIVEMQLPETR